MPVAVVPAVRRVGLLDTGPDRYRNCFRSMLPLVSERSVSGARGRSIGRFGPESHDSRIIRLCSLSSVARIVTPPASSGCHMLVHLRSYTSMFCGASVLLKVGF